jgi:S1-C subfamily serine protease
MAYKLDEDFQYALLELFYLTKHPDTTLITEWEKANNMASIPYHWNTFVDIQSVRSILEKGRDKKEFRESFNINLRWFLNNYIIDQDPQDDNLHTTHYVISEVGERHYECKTLLYIIDFPSQIIEDYKNSIAKVYEKSGNKLGTGFLYDEKYIVTANHVLEEIEVVEICLENGEPLLEKNRLIPKDTKKHDIAIIEIEKPSSATKSFPLDFNTRLLEDVLIMGYPRIPQTKDSYLVYNKGEISSYVEIFKGVTGITLSSFLRGGNSGGPVINKFGDVIGVVSEYLFEKVLGEQALNENVGISFILPSYLIKQLINQEI